jgi:hypothetical protein
LTSSTPSTPSGDDAPDAGGMAWYDQRIETDRVRGLSHPCAECGRAMPATGNLFHPRPPGPSMWLVEYECVHCRERSRIWTPETADLVDAIVAERRETE